MEEFRNQMVILRLVTEKVTAITPQMGLIAYQVWSGGKNTFGMMALVGGMFL